MKNGIFAALLVALFASAALAENGLPSQSKLNKMGLASMQVASDEAGSQVRGKAFSKIIFSWQASAGEKAIRNADGTISIDPANFVANDLNNGAGIIEDGLPLTFGAANAQLVNLAATADHEQVILDSAGNIAFTELSSSRNTATVFAGDFAQFP